LIVVQEIFGVNSHIKSVADGYAADAISLSRRRSSIGSSAGSISATAPATSERGRTFIPKMQWDKVMQDAGAGMDNVKIRAGKVASSATAGRHVSWVAAVRLAGLACSCAYYGAASPG